MHTCRNLQSSYLKQHFIANLTPQLLHNMAEIGLGHHLSRKTRNASKIDLLETPFLSFQNFICIVIVPASVAIVAQAIFTAEITSASPLESCASAFFCVKDTR